MLVTSFIIGGLIFAAVLAVLFAGIHLAGRAAREAQDTAAARRSGTPDVLDVGGVSQAELDEAWNFIQATHSHREPAGVL